MRLTAVDWSRCLHSCQYESSLLFFLLLFLRLSLSWVWVTPTTSGSPVWSPCCRGNTSTRSPPAAATAPPGQHRLCRRELQVGNTHTHRSVLTGESLLSSLLLVLRLLGPSPAGPPPARASSVRQPEGGQHGGGAGASAPPLPLL